MAQFHRLLPIIGTPSSSIFSTQCMSFVLFSNTTVRTTIPHSVRSYRRMLDLGGASADDSKKHRVVNTSQNSKVQAICFDWETLTKAIVPEEVVAADSTGEESSTSLDKTKIPTTLGSVEPNLSRVQQVASLLNVSLGGEGKPNTVEVEDDDLSALTGETPETPSKTPRSNQNSHDNSSIGGARDVRSKYADRLAQKGIGGVAGVDRARQQVQDTVQKGDAAGHFSARQMAAANHSNTDKWMALTGTGHLLQYLTERSMRLCLLPHPTDASDEDGERMEQLKRQLNEVVFHSLIKKGNSADEIVNAVLGDLNLDSPFKVMLVSDRDEYIRSAKELGLVTCRIRPPNARRGNISAHYTIPSVPKVRDVLDEINGISFSAVLKGR